MATLSDIEQREESAAGRLIENGTEEQAAGACYELRIGSVYYDLTESGHPIQLSVDEDVLIKPGHRIVLITHEAINVPDDVLARVVSKGSLFSVGLSPVATYADPGFSGNIGIVTQNISDKYIVLPQLESIAKADFTRLSNTATSLYNGQHGFKTQIWPIKHHLQKTHAEVSSDQRVGSEREEAYLLLPHATSSILRKLERRQRLIDIAIVIAVFLNAIAVFLVGSKIIDNLQGLIGSLVASLLVGLVALYANKRI